MAIFIKFEENIRHYLWVSLIHCVIILWDEFLQNIHETWRQLYKGKGMVFRITVSAENFDTIHVWRCSSPAGTALDQRKVKSEQRHREATLWETFWSIKPCSMQREVFFLFCPMKYACQRTVCRLSFSLSFFFFPRLILKAWFRKIELQSSRISCPRLNENFNESSLTEGKSVWHTNFVRVWPELVSFDILQWCTYTHVCMCVVDNTFLPESDKLNWYNSALAFHSGSDKKTRQYLPQGLASYMPRGAHVRQKRLNSKTVTLSWIDYRVEKNLFVRNYFALRQIQKVNPRRRRPFWFF